PKSKSPMKQLYPILLLVAGAALCAQEARAQYYPAGLSNSNLKLWLSAADATTLTKQGGGVLGNGSSIKKWADKSGNGNDASQTTTGNQPVYKKNALNGNVALVFQNTDQELTSGTNKDNFQTIVGVRNILGTDHYQSLFSSPADQDF